MLYNILKSQLHSFVIRLISTVFRCRPRCQQVIIRASDSFKPGHIPDNRIDTAGPWSVGLCGADRARLLSVLLEAVRSPATVPRSVPPGLHAHIRNERVGSAAHLAGEQ